MVLDSIVARDWCRVATIGNSRSCWLANEGAAHHPLHSLGEPFHLEQMKSKSKTI